MSARQAFLPRPPSRVPSSEPHSHPMNVCTEDGDKDMFLNCSGKARSISAFLGQKRGVNDTASRGAGPTQGGGLGRTRTSTNRRSFEGILRPEMTPLSIIPYPAATQHSGGAKQSGVGQTPRKIAGPGASEFPRPITPVSAPRGPKKGFGIFAGSHEDEATVKGSGNNIVRMGPEGETDVHPGAAIELGGYMRVFEGSGVVGGAGGLQVGLEHNVAAPVPGYALRGLCENPMDERGEIEGIFARSSRPLGAMVEEEVGPQKRGYPHRSLGEMKRGMAVEGMGGNEKYGDEGHHIQGPSKRMKQVEQDPNEYLPISSPYIPPTPRPQTAAVNILDPSLVVGSLLENMEDFVSLEQIEVDWKRWRECTTEEWLKGADELAQEYTDILNMVKDHLTEKVLAYASMVSSVEERRTGVNRNIENIHGRWNVVRENISKLGIKK